MHWFATWIAARSAGRRCRRGRGGHHRRGVASLNEHRDRHADRRRAERGGTIPKETEAELLRLFHKEKWRIGTIAAQLGLHHTKVQRVLRQTGAELKAVVPRPSMEDPFVPSVVQLVVVERRATERFEVAQQSAVAAQCVEHQLLSLLRSSPNITESAPHTCAKDEWMSALIPKDYAEAVALFRSEIVGALTHRELDGGALTLALPS